MTTPADIARQAGQLSDLEWYDFLDQLDEVARQRHQATPPDPTGANRDEVAAWVGKKHFMVDSKIREIWYLPTNSPPDEIRLIESTDRLGGEWGFEPLDFDVEVSGHHYKLLLCETTSKEIESLKQDASRLPTGWTIDRAQIWRRGA